MTDADLGYVDTTSNSQKVPLDLPKSIGPYTILEKIGDGGFATVYLAKRDEADDESQSIALKVLSVPENYGRFRREINTIASLTHPNIIQIFDSGEDDNLVASQGNFFKVADSTSSQSQPKAISRIWNRLTGKLSDNDSAAAAESTPPSVPYFTMEYIPGGSLRDLLDKETYLSIPEALTIIEKVGEALTYAHSQDVIHRDVNPNNILLDNRQETIRPILTDFGLVASVSTDNLQTMTVGLIGTFHYYAPEQWLKAAITPMTDLYALAFTFFEMVAGQRPFKGDIFALRDQHLNDSFPQLSEVAPRVGPFYDDVLRKATAKDPEHRYQSIAAFIEALQDVDRANLEYSKYREIEHLIEEGAYAPALSLLDETFIQRGKYEYREVARLLWGLVHAKQHNGLLPLGWDNGSAIETQALPEEAVNQLADPPPALPQWHQLHKWLVPVALTLATIAGAAIAPRLTNFVKVAGVPTMALLLLSAYFVFYAWSYYFSAPDKE